MLKTTKINQNQTHTRAPPIIAGAGVEDSREMTLKLHDLVRTRTAQARRAAAPRGAALAFQKGMPRSERSVSSAP